MTQFFEFCNIVEGKNQLAKLSRRYVKKYSSDFADYAQADKPVLMQFVA